MQVHSRACAFGCQSHSRPGINLETGRRLFTAHCYSPEQVLIQPGYGALGSRVQRTMTAHGVSAPRNWGGTVDVPL